MSEIRVTADKRVRLVGNVLAAGVWPLLEQKKAGAHAVHVCAKRARNYLAPHREHAAVVATNRHVESGHPPRDLFATAVRCNWPDLELQEALPGAVPGPAWAGQLRDFYMTADLAGLWETHPAAWAEAIADLERIFGQHLLAPFLATLAGRPLQKKLVVVPNLIYPATQTLTVENVAAWYLILPPPRAVGESPPWPYHDGVDWVLAESGYHLTRAVLFGAAAQLTARQQELFYHAATVLFLEEALDEGAALFHQLQAKKNHDLPELPQAAAMLREYVAASAGQPPVEQFARNFQRRD